MIHEEIFDIAAEIEDQALNAWRENVQQPIPYLKSRLDEYQRAPSIAPLYIEIIRGAQTSLYEREIHLLGSFTALDAVVNEHKRLEQSFEMTNGDLERYRRFENAFLMDPRWNTPGLFEGDIVKDVDLYMKLMKESDGRERVSDITPLIQTLNANGPHRLASVIDEATEILVDTQPNEVKSMPDFPNVPKAFQRGGWTVLSMVAIKYGGDQLERSLLAKRVGLNRN